MESVGEADPTRHCVTTLFVDRFLTPVALQRLDESPPIAVGQATRGEATEDSDVDCLVLLDRVEKDDDRAITSLAADLRWQIAGIVVSPMTLSVAEFEAWKARERRTPLEIEREGIPR